MWDPAERTAALGNRAALRHVRCVVAAGGDGTVSAVINELSADVALAVLPLGNENLFAKAFGFEDDPGALAHAIARGARQPIDLGRAHTTAGSRLFTLMLTAGFDAEVVHRFTRWRTAGGAPRRAGRAAYVRPFAEALWSYPHAGMTLTADGVAVDALPLRRGQPARLRAGLASGAGGAGRRRPARLDGALALRPRGAGRLRAGGGPRPAHASRPTSRSGARGI